MRLVVAIFFTIFAAWMQLSWFGHLRPLGVIPNLVLIVVILSSLWLNATTAMLVAIIGGLVLDLASGSDFGLRIAFFLTASLGVVAARQVGLQADSALTGILLVAVGSALYDLAVLATVGFPVSLEVLARIGAGCLDAVLITVLVYVVKSNIPRSGQQTVQSERALWR